MQSHYLKESVGQLANAAQVKVKGENFYRSAKKVKVLKRLTDGKAQRNARGDITKAASYQSREAPVARVEPNRKWFNNTRVISQDALDSFRSAIQAQAADPTSYLLKQNKLPMTLINEPKNVNGLKQHQAKIAVESQPFSDTFGPKAQRKRPKLEFESLEALAGRTNDMHDTYLDRLERAKLLSGTSGEVDEETGEFSTAREAIFSKGTSVRTSLPNCKISANNTRNVSGTNCTRSLTVLMSFYMSSTPEIPLVQDVGPSRSMFARRHRTSILSSC